MQNIHGIDYVVENRVTGWLLAGKLGGIFNAAGS